MSDRYNIEWEKSPTILTQTVLDNIKEINSKRHKYLVKDPPPDEPDITWIDPQEILGEFDILVFEESVAVYDDWELKVKLVKKKKAMTEKVVGNKKKKKGMLDKIKNDFFGSKKALPPVIPQRSHLTYNPRLERRRRVEKERRKRK